MKIAEIYQPITKELGKMESVLGSSLGKSEYQSILEIGDFVMESPGKRIRPALVILSAKASLAGECVGYDFVQLATIAAAVELIHIASLVHDDVIDRANMRHNRASINSRWGDDVSVVFGDYVAGPSHVLPTGGTARFGSPLNITDFIKSINLVSIDRASLKKLGRAASIIARAEGFEAHARAVEKRFKQADNE